jgi:histidinol dehydrogenase
MADEPKQRGETVSLRLAIIVGTTIAAAFTLTQLVVNTVSKSGDRSSEHAHELAMVVVEQMKVQHQDNLKVQEQHRQAIERIAENIEQFAEEQRILSETLRSAYRLPPRSRKTP